MYSIRQEQSFFFDPVDPNDIISILSKLKPKTSRGYDGISIKLIKESIDNIIFPLTRIINQSMSTAKKYEDCKRNSNF